MIYRGIILGGGLRRHAANLPPSPTSCGVNTTSCRIPAKGERRSFVYVHHNGEARQASSSCFPLASAPAPRVNQSVELSVSKNMRYYYSTIEGKVGDVFDDLVKDKSIIDKKHPKIERFYLKKYPPKMIEEMRLDIESKLTQAKKESRGRSRGNRAMKELLYLVKQGNETWPDDFPRIPYMRKYSRTNGLIELRRLLHRRHALRHGAKNLEEFTESELAQTAYGVGTDKKLTLTQMKNVLFQVWRYGHSSNLDDMFKGEAYDLQDNLTQKEIKAEEEREKREDEIFENMMDDENEERDAYQDIANLFGR